MKHKKTFLGIGWKFPPTFDKYTQSVEMVSEEEDIKESLQILLSTKPGERVMMADFGCDIQSINFETINETTLTFLKRKIEKAIIYFEPRIDLNFIKTETYKLNEGVLLIDINYTIRNTNTRSNMVYPYYFIEGTDIR